MGKISFILKTYVKQFTEKIRTKWTKRWGSLVEKFRNRAGKEEPNGNPSMKQSRIWTEGRFLQVAHMGTLRLCGRFRHVCMHRSHSIFLPCVRLRPYSCCPVSLGLVADLFTRILRPAGVHPSCMIWGFHMCLWPPLYVPMYLV